MACIGQGEMVLARCKWSPIQSNASRHNSGGAKAPIRRVCLLQIVAILGTMICKNSVLVAGVARADEARNYLRIGLGERPREEGVVLQGSPYTVALERPTMVSSLRLSGHEELEEVLSVKLKLLRGKASAFRVFINLPDADEKTAITCSEFSGSYLHEPRRVKSPDYEYQATIFRIGISDIIRELGLVEQPSILVTFVPCGADKGLPIALKSVKIELD